MIKKIRFSYHFKKGSYTKALSILDQSAAAYDNKSLWACFQLGLYSTVLDSRLSDVNNFSLAAILVSASAKGNKELAYDLSKKLLIRKPDEKLLGFVARSISGYLPQLSLILLENIKDISVKDYTLILESLGQRKESLGFLADLKKHSKDNELHLIVSNIEETTPECKLQRLNLFLEGYGLSPLLYTHNEKNISPITLFHNKVKKIHHDKKVSIIITTFNTGSRLSNCVNSLINQSWKNIELIIVDDCSTDETPIIARKLERDHPNIIFLSTPKNMGTYVAKTLALKHTTGEYIMCHDSDDWSHPLRIEKQMLPIIQNPNVLCTMSNWVRMNDNGIFQTRNISPLVRLNPSSLLFNKDIILKRCGSWDLVRAGADSEFISRIKLVMGSGAIKKVNLPLSFGSYREDSLMNSPDSGHLKDQFSPSRLSYWESWNNWHIRSLYFNNSLRYTNDFLRVRPFAAPIDILICEKLENYISLNY